MVAPFRGSEKVCAIVAFVSLLTPLLIIPRAYSDTPAAAPADKTPAPNVGGNYQSLDNVYNWIEVPDGRAVQIQAAVFNTDGYVLFDKAGETINVPFVRDNLYTMQFAQTAGRAMYLVNAGGQPVLYVPKDGYLIGVPPYYGPITGAYSADCAGGRWYPFTKDYYPINPVYMGPAPTWAAFLNMPWYPGVKIEGGYWSGKPVTAGVFVSPTPGLLFVIDGHIYSNWAGFMSYAILHPTPSDRDDEGGGGMGGGHGGHGH